MDAARGKATITELDGPRWELSNGQIRAVVTLNDDGLPVLSGLTGSSLRDQEWAVGSVLGPEIEADGRTYEPGSPDMTFVGGKVDAARPALCLSYECSNGLQVRHWLEASPAQEVVRLWTDLTNGGADEVSGLCRFDVVGLHLGVSAFEPEAAYVLGWLDGPRIDAPGKHATPFAYSSWIPRLLYGDDAAVPPPPPSGGWASPSWRLITERLTMLPLRSGKRSTYDNHPWFTVMDPGRGAGFYLGLEWSGTWKMDVEHLPEPDEVSVLVHTDGDTHTLKPGQSLASPRAFFGLFGGDWDDAFNACRRYVRDEILPKTPFFEPPVRYNIGCPRLPQHTPELYRAEIDAAADLGFENFTIDAMWWEDSPDDGDFSLGLGNFGDNRRKFPDGLRAVSDYVHDRGMRFGLWFEFERVDIRTAFKGRNPWSPDWLLHQKGHPYRSWCQHVYLMCLGVEAAAEWALENMAWGIEEFRVDWLKIDGNEWAVCDDPTHDHGETDGEWAQTQGLYHIMSGLRERFPDLIIENCAGGSQRADFGMGPYCLPIQTHDRSHPSVLQRRYSHGCASMYPSTVPLLDLGGMEGIRADTTPEQLEWRLLNRMMGAINSGGMLTSLGSEKMEVMRKGIATYKKLRPHFGDVI